MILEDVRGTKKYVGGTGFEKVLSFYIFWTLKWHLGGKEK
jgi:hypothetical protein